jgi:hypothetical protein
MTQTHAQFLAELRGYVALFALILGGALVAHVVGDYRAWRDGKVRPPSQRHTRAHHDTRRPR